MHEPSSPFLISRKTFLRCCTGGLFAVGALGAFGKASASPTPELPEKSTGGFSIPPRRGLTWRETEVDPRVHAALRALAEYQPIVEGEPSANSYVLEIALRDDGAISGHVERVGKKVLLKAHHDFPVGRLLSWALADKLEDGVSVEDRAFFERRGIMFDLARNAALKPEAFGRWFSQMFLMGYNHANLYLEDMLELEGEPYFGYLRGRYKLEELRRIDEAAATFGIEVTASIQTLSHLAQVLKWPVYAGIKENLHTVKVGDKATYALIGKMLDAVSASIRSRRIHVGMDESTAIKFPDFQSHLKRVHALCKERGYTSVEIWSDMYFRMTSRKHDYYDKEIVFPAAMKGCVPEGVKLVYWDYNSFDEEFYVQWIDKHKELSGGSLPAMAAGLRTWTNSFWFSQRSIASTVTPAMAACRRSGVTDVLFTMWRDDGAFCHYNSVVAGLAYASDQCFENSRWREDVFDAVIGLPWQALVEVSSIADNLNPTMIAWDDPLIGVTHKMLKRCNPGLLEKTAADYARLLEAIAPLADVTEPVDFAFGVAMIDFLRRKILFQDRLDVAYAARDRSAVGALAGEVPELIASLEKFIDAFRRQWQAAHRPFGLEVMQARFGCQLLRLRDARGRLEEYAGGKTETLEELDEDIVPPLPRKQTGEHPHQALKWQRIYTNC